MNFPTGNRVLFERKGASYNHTHYNHTSTNITFKSNMRQKRTEKKNPLMVHKNMIWQRKPMSMSVTSVIRSRTNSWFLVFNLQIYCEEKAFLFIMS